jgi:hypothetical protein
VIHQYDRSSTPVDSAAAFSLVGKDGTVRFALAVWIQNEMLQYTAQDGSQGELPLDAMDRGATYRLNAEKRLSLTLPAEAPRT